MKDLQNHALLWYIQINLSLFRTHILGTTIQDYDWISTRKTVEMSRCQREEMSLNWFGPLRESLTLVTRMTTSLK